MVKGSEHQGLTLKIVKMVEEDKIPQHAVAKDLLGLIHQSSKKDNNGQSLHQHQENGLTLQIITQIPLFMNNHQTELTIQWNGKTS